MNWTPRLLKSATAHGAGLHPSTWVSLANRSPLEVPAEVQRLYETTDGARFPGEVRLWTWKEVEAQTSQGLGKLKPDEVWLLGTKRQSGLFFTARARHLLRAVPSTARAEWLTSIDANRFVYGLWPETDAAYSYLVRSLEELITLNIPRPGEDFSEVTYVRALGAVKNALAGLQPPPKKKSPAARPKKKG